MKRITALLLAVFLLSTAAGCDLSSSETVNDEDYDDTIYYDAQGDAAYDESAENEQGNADLDTGNTAPAEPQHVHNYLSSVTREATCAKEGVTTYRCSCGASYTEPIAKKTYHDWTFATCTTPDKCKICGTTRVEPQGHSYSTDGKCFRCGAINPVVTNTVAKCSLTLPILPQEVSYYGYANKVYSSVEVTAITYQFNCDNEGRIELKLSFSGKKTYDYRGDGQSDSCKIGWKLYSQDGSIIRSGTFYSPSVRNGETFSNQSETALYSFDNAAAGKYRLEISSVN